MMTTTTQRQKSTLANSRAKDAMSAQLVRVLFVHRWGAMMAGGEVWIESLARHLTTSGTHVDALVGMDGPLIEALNRTGVRANRITLSELRTESVRSLFSSGVALLQSIRSIIVHARRNGANVIHTFSLECAAAAYVAARVLRVPLVMTVMNCGPFPALDLRFARRADALVTVSSAVACDLVRAGADPLRIRVIACGIDDVSPVVPADIRSQLRSALGIPSEAPVIGMVATLERKKAQDVLIQALPDILAEVPDAYVCLLGSDHESSPSTPGPYESELRKLAARCNVADRVRFGGYRSNARVLVAGFDVAVLCSRKEALGMAAIEAMACGVPVVASGVEGLAEVITHEETGLLVQPDDSDALASQILRLLRNPDYASQLGLAGQESVQERFDACRLAATSLHVYEQVLAGGLNHASAQGRAKSANRKTGKRDA